MTIPSFPSEVTDADRRLRILWIDDKISQLLHFTTLGSAVDQLIQIVAVDGPKLAWDLLNGQEHADLRLGGFDAFVTDFRLSDRLAAVTGHGQEVGPASGDAETDGDLGMFAPSAGFLIGVLFSLHYPAQPSVVIPYSGHPSEFGDTWKLVRAFMPSRIRVANPDIIGKTDTSQTAAIRACSSEYRKTVLHWCERKDVIVDTAQVARTVARAEGGRIPLTTPLILITEKQARSIHLGALFLDSKLTERGIPLDDVVRFIEAVPPLDPHHVKARRIADEYIDLAERPASRGFYAQVWAALDSGQAPVADLRPEIRSWLGKAGESNWSADDRRNALLIILVYIHARYMLPVQILQRMDEEGGERRLGSAIAEIIASHRLDLFPLVKDGLREVLKAQGLDDDDPVYEAVDNLHRAGPDPTLDARGRFERLLQRYVDPCPEPGNAITGRITLEAKLGKGLQRLLDGGSDGEAEPRSGSRRLKGILEDRECLDYARLDVARAYASRVLPPTFPWPRWLTPTDAKPTEPGSAIGPE